MASPNVELVRSIFAGWERGDYSAIDWVDPDIEFVIADGPGPGTWRGLAGMVEGFRGWISVFEDYRVLADEYRELDNHRVLVILHASGRAKASGVDLATMQKRQGANLFQIGGGKVTRLVLYWEAERALSDLGLSSEASAG